MNRLFALALLVMLGCEQSKPENKTILLGGTYNINLKCVGHAEGLCGTEGKMLPTEIAGIFATEPDCQGLRLRGLTEKERSTPGNQLPSCRSTVTVPRDQSSDRTEVRPSVIVARRGL
jgi:hypothetical protein